MSQSASKSNTMAKFDFHREREQAVVRELDAIVRDMVADLPSKPYIMETPSDHPYILARSEIDNWCMDTPFEPHERELQYMTFCWRDPSTTLFSLKNFPEDEPSDSLPAVKEASPPKKKIKFEAYKNRKLLQATASANQDREGIGKLPENKTEEKIVETEGPKSRFEGRTDDTNAFKAVQFVAKFKTSTSPDKPPTNSPSHLETVPGPNSQEFKHKQHTALSSIEPSEPVVLRPVKASDSVNVKRQNSPYSNRLANTPSPGTPSWVIEAPADSMNVSKDSRLPTPPMESPMAGVNFLKSASAISQMGPSLWHSSSSAEATKALPELTDIDDSQMQSRKVKSSNSNNKHKLIAGKRPPSVVPSSRPTPTTSIPEGKLTSTSGTVAKTSTATSSHIVRTETPTYAKKKLIVKLKFSRGNTKIVDALLKLKPRSACNTIQADKSLANEVRAQALKASKVAIVANTDREAPAVVGNQYLLPQKSQIKTVPTFTPQSNRDVGSPLNYPEKRTRESDLPGSGTMTKRIKSASSGPDNQTTPTRTILQETGSSLKNSNTVKTTSASLRGQDSVSKTVNNSELRFGSTLRNSRSPQAWIEESVRLQNLGKVLKRQAARTYGAVKDAKSKEDAIRLSKLYCLERIESVLCFILFFTVVTFTQNPHPNWLSNWRSLIPMAAENVHASRDFQELNGLCALLMAVCYTHITNLTVELKRSGVASTEDPALQLANMVRDLQHAQKHGADAERQLPRRVLLDRYKSTSKYYESLPVSLSIKPAVAAKLALIFMEEWASDEKLQWSQRLEQSACEQLDV